MTQIAVPFGRTRILIDRLSGDRFVPLGWSDDRFTPSADGDAPGGTCAPAGDTAVATDTDPTSIAAVTATAMVPAIAPCQRP
jgi:hypothetical protein